jgi:GT2 family glycosyltransferase
VGGADSRVAVVIITRDRLSDLERTLERLEALPERPEVVVVDNGSRDGTPAALRARFPRVRVLVQAHDLGAAGRTAGVLAVSAPYVAFCDDDSWWEPGALARAADLLDAHGDLGVVAARVMLPGGELEPTCAAMAESPLRGRDGLPGPRVLGFVACGAVVRRRAYLTAGGFEPGRGVGGEEQPLAAALADRGWELCYVAGVVAHHRPSGRRDPGARRAGETRNDLWFAWQRRPARAAARATVAELRRAGADPRRWCGAAAAARGLPRALRARRVVGPRVERELAELATSGRSCGSPGRSPRPGSP